MNRQNQRNWNNNPNQQSNGGYDYGYYTSGNPNENMNRNYEENNYPNQNYGNNNYQNQNLGNNNYQDQGFGQNNYQDQGFGQNNFDNRNFGNNDYQQQNFGYNNYQGNNNGGQQHRPYYPSISGTNEDDFLGNDHGYAGGNPGFEETTGEFLGNYSVEANNNFGVGTGRSDIYNVPQNNWQQNRRAGFSSQGNYNRNNVNRQRSRPMGQTMDSWDNDFEHWRTHGNMRGSTQTEQYNSPKINMPYRPQNQGYFGENIPRYSGGNLYNPRFSNNESRARYNTQEDRWHADSLSDTNIDSWGR